MKLWGGRFTRETDREVQEFQASLRFDWRLYPYDIRGSQAHVTMLAQQGILTQEEARVLREGLEGIRVDLDQGRLVPTGDYEDIHSFVEAELIRRVGEVGKKLHTARSRNDQVALDLRLFVREAIDQVDGLLAGLQAALLEVAERDGDAVLPGYTHLQRAQPVLLAHHLLAYVEMLERDRDRLQDCRRRTNVNPLGAGALAGSGYPLDPDAVARELGFESSFANSLDAVSDRDFAVEFLAALALVMMHLSRFCEEAVLWSSQEFGFIEMDDAYSTGSSIMPQKKNPDVAELTRGKTGRVYGALVSLLTMMKGLPLAYNKDMQEDKEPLFDAVDTVTSCLRVVTGMVRTLRVRRDRMRAAVQDGFLNATDLADYLVGKGIPFREAHRIVGEAVLYCVRHGLRLEELPLEKLQSFCPLIDAGVYEALDVERCVAVRNSPGGTGPQQVRQRLQQARQRLAARRQA